jgi:hypothetical protein
MGKGSWLGLLFVLLIAAGPRLYNNSWDDYHGLHPDERFMAMVTNDITAPSSFAEYLDPNRSPLNPYNVKNAEGGRQFPLFVYGTLPVTIIKLTAKALGEDNYAGYMKVGRVVSAAADLLSLACWFVVVAVVGRFYSWPKVIPFVFGFFYSLAVLPIQLSHFYAVDTFLNAACAFALMAALYARTTGKVYWFGLAGAGLGVSFACKISALFFAPLVVAVALVPYPIVWTKAEILRTLRAAAWKGGIMAILAFVLLRICDPHFFESSSLLNPSISKQFLSNLEELMRLSSRQEWPWPPSIQWLASTPLVSPLSNIFWFGLGPIVSLLALLGLFSRRVWSSPFALLLGAWGLLFVLYQGTRFAHTMRYFLIVYPILALFAAHGFILLSNRRASLLGHLTQWGVLAVLVLLWPLAFLSLYTKPHSRVQASYWILDNIPSGSALAVEHWDDSLPIGVDSRGRDYVFRELGVFGMDTPEKWQAIDRALQGTNYIVLSSNRGYGSMGQLPEKYPKTREWYDSLFNETGAWEKIYDLHPKPGIAFGPIRLEWDTQKAEEAFSVYDHPRVTIFRRKQG